MLTQDEWQEWNRRTAIDREDGFDCPLWRLARMYSVLDREGALVPFEPTPEQIEIIVAIHIRGWRRLVIPKARQLGCSTVIVLIGLDMVLFVEGYSCALVDKRADDAEKKFREKVLVAWDALDPEIRASYKVEGQTTTRISLRDVEGQVVSSYEVGVSFRGGRVQFLHVSEWGWIQEHDPTRSKEILTGSLPACESGIIVVETTWSGGKGGDLWPFVEEALNTPEESRGPDTWRLLFFNWTVCDEYATPHGHEDPASTEYLDGIQKHLEHPLTREQRRWYAGQRRKLGWLVRQEYPTTLDECWHSPVAGAIYGEEMDRLRGLGRVGKAFEFLRELPIFTSWDLGLSDYTSMWLVQPHGTELLWLDWYEGEGEAASHYAGKVQQWENQYKPITRHFLPHDAGKREVGSGYSYVATLASLSIKNVTVVPVTSDVWWGIGRLRELLARSTFHANCSFRRKGFQGREKMSGVECLEAYRRRIEPGPSGSITEAPVHDHASHSADGARTFAEALAKGLVPTTAQVSRELMRERVGGIRQKARAIMNVGG